MFGLFKKKPAAQVPADATRVSETRPELSAEQKRMINEELERQGSGQGDSLDAAIGLLHLTGDDFYHKGVLQFLENREVALLLKDPAGADFLILTNESLRYLPVFTRPQHALAITKKFPSYPHVGLVNSRALFTKLEPGLGLWINPGHSIFTYIMPPMMFTTYVGMLKKREQV